MIYDKHVYANMYKNTRTYIFIDYLITPKYPPDNIPITLPIPIPKAPPLPPSPTINVITGTFNADITSKFVAILSLCPSRSQMNVGQAPILKKKITN